MWPIRFFENVKSVDSTNASLLEWIRNGSSTKIRRGKGKTIARSDAPSLYFSKIRVLSGTGFEPGLDPIQIIFRVNLHYAGFKHSDCLKSLTQPIRMLKESIAQIFNWTSDTESAGWQAQTEQLNHDNFNLQLLLIKSLTFDRENKRRKVLDSTVMKIAEFKLIIKCSK